MPADGGDGPYGDAGYDGAYQGVPGAFSEEAARRWLGTDASLLPCRTIGAVLDALRSGRARHAIVATENSLAGPVPDAAALAADRSVRAIDEQRVAIVQALIGVPGARLADLEEVRSHAVALAQCRRLLAACPRLRPVVWFDTAGAVRDVVSEGRRAVAAIAGAAAARRYGGVVLLDDVTDGPGNVTTFQLVVRSPPSMASAIAPRAPMSIADPVDGPLDR